MADRTATIITLGCPKNEVLSRKIKNQLINCGLSLPRDSDNCELVLVNTCGFIRPAKEESIELLLELVELKKQGRCRQIFAIGCLVQRHQEELYKAIPEVDGFLNFQDLRRLPEIIGAAPSKGDGESIDLEGKPWAYLQISEGCNRRCSFCVIPKIKGPYRSRPLPEILYEAESLVDRGAKEIIIVGQDTGAYGVDLRGKKTLVDLINEISAIKDLKWLRLMYLQPDNLSSELIDAFRNGSKLCRYIDIPFQHASRNILRSMNRAGDAVRYLRQLERLREAVPNITIRSEVIVGYPGESANHFRELVDFINAAEPDYLGIFKFSAEEGTRAYSMGNQVTPRVIDNRYYKLKTVADQIGCRKKDNLVGKRLPVLIESQANDYVYEGRLEIQAPEIDGGTSITTNRQLGIGQIVDCFITAANGYDLEADLI